MPRAEPALSLATLPLSAVIGAAITTGITTPVTPGGPPPQSGGLGQGVPPTPLKGALGAGGCAGTTTLRLPQGKPRADRALPRTRGPKGRTGGGALPYVPWHFHRPLQPVVMRHSPHL